MRPVSVIKKKLKGKQLVLVEIPQTPSFVGSSLASVPPQGQATKHQTIFWINCLIIAYITAQFS